MDITSFLLYCFIVTFTPGPTNIVILSIVHNYGPNKAIEYTYGATIAFGLLLGISAILNAALLTVIPKVLIGMKLIGTIYMLYLAYQIFKMNSSNSTDYKTGTFISGFLMQFLNPKVVIFTLTVIPSFVLPNYTDTFAVTISVIVITIIGLLGFVSWVLFGTFLKKLLQKHSRIVNLIMAVGMVYATLMIWI
ncbi:LysE family translocator [Sutcliffiella rhizosphaerae]|uniref:Cysteine/O-acetylserine efflux protein n=1 Tax=Sutcliffiella rhizosphaerae TaxID=2880967 RepID=A0ABM8YQZ9_9BACI|nr:LysE family transporter [Sutcliffiella rhizosphaerae]CAG9622276.1 Cysteine/O-acetylserine efflux protein [Sutcliffiella rhizosphaerae]